MLQHACSLSKEKLRQRWDGPCGGDEPDVVRVRGEVTDRGCGTGHNHLVLALEKCDKRFGAPGFHEGELLRRGDGEVPHGA